MSAVMPDWHGLNVTPITLTVPGLSPVAVPTMAAAFLVERREGIIGSLHRTGSSVWRLMDRWLTPKEGTARAIPTRLDSRPALQAIPKSMLSEPPEGGSATFGAAMS